MENIFEMLNNLCMQPKAYTYHTMICKILDSFKKGIEFNTSDLKANMLYKNKFLQ